MKTLLLLFVLFGESKCTEPKTVYICASKHAQRYHYRADCRGLKNCTYQIVKTTIADAKKSGKTLCHLEK
ncbi:MAG: hypothetical protein V4592_08155 [Bacteroidota bacterium]